MNFQMNFVLAIMVIILYKQHGYGADHEID